MLKLSPQIRAAGDATAWGAVILTFFADYAGALNGIACFLAAIWTSLQIYGWIRQRRKK